MGKVINVPVAPGEEAVWPRPVFNYRAETDGTPFCPALVRKLSRLLAKTIFRAQGNVVLKAEGKVVQRLNQVVLSSPGVVRALSAVASSEEDFRSFFKTLGFTLSVEKGTIVIITEDPLPLSPLEQFRRDPQNLDQAAALVDQGHAIEVEHICLSVLQNPAANLGMLRTAFYFFFKRGDWQNAISAGTVITGICQRAKAATEEDRARNDMAHVYADLGEAYLKLRQPQLAKQVLDEGIALLPEKCRAFFTVYGTVNEEIGADHELLSLLMQMKGATPAEIVPNLDFFIFETRFIINLSGGVTPEEAAALISEFEAFLQENPAAVTGPDSPVPELRLLAVWTYLQAGNLGPARRCLEEGVGENLFLFQGLKACLLSAEGAREEAWAAARLAMAEKSSVRVKRIRALANAVEKILKEAEEAARPAPPPPDLKPAPPPPPPIPGGINEETFRKVMVFRNDWAGYYRVFTKSRETVETLIGELGAAGALYSTGLVEGNLYTRAPELFRKETALPLDTDSKQGKAVEALAIARITLVWEDATLKVRFYAEPGLIRTRAAHKSALYFEGKITEEARVELTPNHNENLRVAGLFLEALLLESIYSALYGETESLVEAALP